MDFKTGLIRILALSAFLFYASNAFAQNELRATFFKDVDAALARATAADAELLAPKSFAKGTKAYAAAELGLSRGRNIQFLGDKTADAADHYDLAIKTAGLAKTVLAQVLKSRRDALSVNSNELSSEFWNKAHREFKAAIRYLERGDLKNAKRKGIEATSLYRDAELVAIKAQYLTQTRQLLKDADKRKIGRYAPFTLNKAKQLLSDAERELEENRYDTDYPRSLAQQANYEAKHAFYLADVALAVRSKDLSPEMLVLQWEQPLREIAGAADLLPAMATGPEDLKKELVAFIENSRNDVQSLEQEIASTELRFTVMQDEIRRLDERLGGATAERLALSRRLAAQARVKAKFERVEIMFAKQEARVFREGDDIILRLVGLSFDSGKSDLKRSSMELLKKVGNAIDIFPRSELVIEGHTDSYGGDMSNQLLSQKRAESLQQFIITQMRISRTRVMATGYGETSPVANNETEAGRAKNRRIDIVIKPNLDAA
jgi:outer membrane protein OmpA-like peptidoglycan-associated protein/HEPN domain-containing protein